MFEVNIYLETSLKGPVVKDGWYAAVIEYQTKSHGVQTREVFKSSSETTYHKSALLAFIESLKILNKECRLTVHTDSIYLISPFQNGNFERWLQNGFISAKDEPIKNQAEWKEIAERLGKHKVSFIRERRHAYTIWMMEEAKKRFKTGGDSVNTKCEGVLA